MQKQYSTVIIGFGGMGQQHFNTLVGNEYLKVTGVCDIDSNQLKLAEEHQLKTYRSIDLVLSDPSVDVILIATPNDTHKLIAIHGLKSKKHVICEKPVTINAKDLKEILEVQEKSGYVFMVHQNRRWDEDFLTIKKIYDQKSLGNLYRVEQRVYGSRGIPGDWRKYKQFGGGMLLDWGVHMLDRLLVMIPEKIVRLYCELSYVLEEEVDDGYKAFIEFESGKTALLEVGTTNMISLPKWYCTFTRGTAIIEDWHMNGRIVELTKYDEKDAKPIIAGAGLTKTMAPRNDNSTRTLPLDIVKEDHRVFYKNFVGVIEKKEEPIVKNQEVLRVMKVIDALFESGRKKQVIAYMD